MIDFLHSRLVKTWLIPAATSLLLLWMLLFYFPFTYGYSSGKLTLGMQVWLLCIRDEDFQYCLIVPFMCLLALFLRRDRLARAPVAPSNYALGLLILGLFFFWIGLRSETQIFGFIGVQILLAALVLWYWGTKVFLSVLFPWAFFAFIWPLPFLVPMISVPLRLTMTHLTADILNLLQVGCIQNGTGLLSAPVPARGLGLGERFQIDVADACSGMRSLFALVIISALYSNLFLPRLWQQWVVFLCAFPLAMLGNLARLLILTFGSIAFGSTFAIGSNDTPSSFHEGSGFFIYVVALGLELLLGNFLLRHWPEKSPARNESAAPSPAPAS